MPERGSMLLAVSRNECAECGRDADGSEVCRHQAHLDPAKNAPTVERRYVSVEEIKRRRDGWSYASPEWLVLNEILREVEECR